MNDELKHCRNVNENPCNMCMPMGGILALKGIESSMVILHGSQGCSTYMRRHIAEHFNEPVDVASSSLNEKGTIYGGESNLKQAIDNVRKVYEPKLIGILTTCLAETIGEDVERIADSYSAQQDAASPLLVSAATPGYGGSHAEGYFFTLRRIVEQLAEPVERHSKVNIILPNLSPADIREIKRILQLLQVDYILYPDISDTLDRPFLPRYTKLAQGGTPLADIKAMGGSVATIQMGMTVEDKYSPGQYLADAFGVPLYNIPLPIGLKNTDLFLECLQQHAAAQRVPLELQQERGRLLDGMIDSHKYNFQKRSVIFGEPEIVYAVAKTCLENGLFPVVIATGSKTTRLDALLRSELAASPEACTILNETDFAAIRQSAKEAEAVIAIGHSDGRYLEERQGIPLIRLGFPIHDRVGGQRLLSVGYRGTAFFLDRITNSLLEKRQKTYRRSLYETFYQEATEERRGDPRD